MKKIGIIGLIIFIIDRAVKCLITNNLILNVRNEIISGFFYLTNCHNEGAAFSLFSGNVLFLIIFTLVILYLLYRVLKKSNLNNIIILAYGLLFGGILGNLFDRIIFGYVIDYLDFIIFKYNFPVFNIADICIITGALLIVIFEGSEK